MKRVSRREFVQGRFGALLGRAASTDAAADEPSSGQLPVMRYPSSLADITAPRPADAEVAADTAAGEVAARRHLIPVMRPPGAVDEETFLRTCTRCNKCIDDCPHDAIVLAPQQMRTAAGTPMLSADHAACMMCDDFPCISACEPGALTRDVPLMMGTAKITQHLCLAHHGTTCTVCSERCPVDHAIDVVDGRPTIRESTCTGCGVCRYVCPAPENAILLMPTYSRPSPGSSTT